MQRLCFIHIPKTAGTAVTDLLEQHYPTDKTLPCIFMHEYRSMDPASFQNYSLYKGHVHLNFARQHFPADTQFVTVIRDPVERVISQYLYVNKTGREFLERTDLPQAQRQATHTALNESILDYLKSDDPMVQQTTRNLQIFVFVGKERYQELKRQPGELAKAAYAEVSRFLCVGVQELLPFFAFELGRALHLPHAFIPSVNINKGKSEQLAGIEKDELSQAKLLIKELNQAEILFYDMIRRDVQHRINAYFSQLSDAHEHLHSP